MTIRQHMAVPATCRFEAASPLPAKALRAGLVVSGCALRILVSVFALYSKLQWELGWCDWEDLAHRSC